MPSAHDLLYDRVLLKKEISEKRLDLAAFMEAREIVRRRVLEVKDSQSPLTPLPNWSGTDAVLGSLDLAIHAMEHTLEDLNRLLEEAPNRLTLLPGGDA